MSTDTAESRTAYATWDALKVEAASRRTSEQQAEYDEGLADARSQIELAELVYRMRTQAGISQSELARRMGVRQPFISDLERGGRTPTVATLSRVAQATGNRLHLVAEPV